MTILPYRLYELDEVRGPLNHIEDTNEGLLALIGQVPVLLPPELIDRLRAAWAEKSVSYGLPIKITG